MSYCRWSSDNMKSDVYAYEDVVGGITIHIRSSYPVDADKVPDLNIESLINDRSPENQAIWFENKKKRDEIINNLTWKEHTKPYAGKTISVDDENEMLVFFEKLRGYGYYIPKIVL